MRLEQVIRSAVSRAGVVQVQNALNPFLWAFVWSLIFAVMTYIFRDDPVVKYACLALAAIPELTALGVGVIFAVKCPDRLQSERFVIEQQEQQLKKLKILYRHGVSPEVLDATKDVERIEQVLRAGDEGEDK